MRLAGLGVLLGLVYLPATLESSVTLSHHGAFVRTLLLLLYPMAVAFTGLGAAFYRPILRVPRRAAGAALLGFLAAALFVNFLTTDAGWLALAAVLHVLTLGGFYLLVGGAVAEALAGAHAAGRAANGWASHLGGLLAGYLLSDVIVEQVGVNAALFALGVGLLVTPRGWALVTIALFLVPTLDLQIEKLRNFGVLLTESDELGIGRDGTFAGEQLRLSAKNLRDPVWMAWSRYGQTSIIRADGTDLMVTYNLRRAFDVERDGRGRRHKGGSGERRAVREAIYGAFPEGGAVMVIGTGSGRGLTYLPSLEGVIAVERNPPTVRFFRDLRPDTNEGVYQRAHVLAADGRYAVERHEGKLDALVFESSRYQPDHALLPATTPFSLVTREAVAGYLDALRPRGLLVMEFSRAGEVDDHAFVPGQVHTFLAAAGVPYARIVAGPQGTEVYLACKAPGCLDTWLAAIDLPTDDSIALERTPTADAPALLTDDRPFVSWLSMPVPLQRQLLGLAASVVAIALVIALRLGRHSRPATLWFFALGVAHTCLQTHSFYAWRSFFGDEIGTILRLIVTFLATGALGAWAVGRVRARGVGLTLTAIGLLAAHLLFLRYIPFTSTDAWVRQLYGVLGPMPAGLVMGALFPLGLLRARMGTLGVWIAADALGTLAGAALVYLVCLPFGLDALGLGSVAVYVAITLLRRPGG